MNFHAPYLDLGTVAGPLDVGMVLEDDSTAVGVLEIPSTSVRMQIQGNYLEQPLFSLLDNGWYLPAGAVTRNAPKLGPGLSGYDVQSVTLTIDGATINANPFPTPGYDWSGQITARIYGREILPVSGDYNQDGYVDVADYVMWRNRNGMDGSLPIESGQTPFDVTQEDYDFWRANFGRTAWDELLVGTSVPEPLPTSCIGVLTAAWIIFARRPMIFTYCAT
jgi:hypothetical protein